MIGTGLLRRVFILLLFTSLCGCSAAAYPPQQALLINTREEMGCLARQQIREDVSEKVNKEDRNFAIVRESNQTEDVSDRAEIYLIFKARPAINLDGFIIFRLGCTQTNPASQAFLELDAAGFYNSDGNWGISLRAKGQGVLRVDTLYSKTPKLQQTWAVCPAVGIREPKRLAFFNVFPVTERFPDVPMPQLKTAWQRFNIRFNPSLPGELQSVAGCLALLESLDKGLTESGQSLTWKMSKIRNNLKAIVSQNSLKNKVKYRFALKIYDENSTTIGAPDFSPQLRQVLAVKDEKGKLGGAELWLRVD